MRIRTKRQSDNVRTYGPMVEETKIAILAEDYPETILTESQLESIQSGLVKKIIAKPEGTVKPTFKGISLKAGWMVLNCGNVQTALWVKDTIKTITPWEGARLNVVDGEDIPKPDVYSVDFTNSADNSTKNMFHIIQGQNVGVSLEKWKTIVT